MVGSAVSSSTPNDFQPNSHKGVEAVPQIILRAMPAPPGMAYTAVGMQRALHSAIGLPSRSTSALWMLVFLMPADVRRSFIMPFLERGNVALPRPPRRCGRGVHRDRRRDRPEVIGPRATVEP